MTSPHLIALEDVRLAKGLHGVEVVVGVNLPHERHFTKGS